MKWFDEPFKAAHRDSLEPSLPPRESSIPGVPEGAWVDPQGKALDTPYDPRRVKVYRWKLEALQAERDRYRDALERIRDRCGDDSAPEDNAVQIAREALAEIPSRCARPRSQR